MVAAVAALGLVGATAASGSPPNYNAAEAVCASSGGDPFVDEGDLGYACLGLPDLTDSQFNRGQAVCEHAYGGTFRLRPSGYICARS